MVTRVLLGKFPAGDNSPNGYGLRISKPGYEVTVANPDNEKLVFNSDWEGILPLHMSGLINSGGSVSHGLGYIPFISAMVNIAGRGWEQYVCLNYGARVMSKRNVKYFGFDTQPSNPTTQTPSEKTAERDFTVRPQNRYAFQENRNGLDTCNVYVDATSLYFTCSSSAQAYYMIYRWKAFNA